MPVSSSNMTNRYDQERSGMTNDLIHNDKRFITILNSRPKVSSPLTTELKLEPTPSELQSDLFSPIHQIMNNRTMVSFMDCLLNSLFVLSLSRIMTQSTRENLSFRCLNRILGSQVNLSTVLLSFVIFKTTFKFISSPSDPTPHHRSIQELTRTGFIYLTLIGLTVWLPPSTRYILESIALISLAFGIGSIWLGLLHLVEVIIELDDPIKLEHGLYQPIRSQPSKHSVDHHYPHDSLDYQNFNKDVYHHHYPVSPLTAHIIKKRYHHLLNPF